MEESKYSCGYFVNPPTLASVGGLPALQSFSVVGLTIKLLSNTPIFQYSIIPSWK